LVAVLLGASFLPPSSVLISGFAPSLSKFILFVERNTIVKSFLCPRPEHNKFLMELLEVILKEANENTCE